MTTRIEVEDGAACTTESSAEVKGQVPSNEKAQQGSNEKTSNEYVLNVAFLSFFIFMATQGCFAIIANSQSMLADSMAMSIDAFTYLFNLLAERLKHRTPPSFAFGEIEAPISMEESRRRKKLMRLYLEFFPPLISVTALLIMSAQVMMDAMQSIINPPVETEANAPNALIMFIFSTLNLLLDVLNVTCFAKIQNFNSTPHIQLLGGAETETRSFETDTDDVTDSDNENDHELGDSRNMQDTSIDPFCDDMDVEHHGLLDSSAIIDYGGTSTERSTPTLFGGDDGLSVGEELLDDDLSEVTDDSETSDKGFNLNMCSAYTHVMADTLRSISVFVAASIACLVESVSSEYADSAAAVVVSVIIFVSVGPLVMGLVKTWKRIRELKEINHARGRDYDLSTLPWMEQFQHLPYPSSP